MKILAIGGTGSVGSQVIQQLVMRGADVRALVRNKDSISKLPKEVEPVIGDLLDPASVEAGLDGVDKLYLLNAVTPDELTQGLIAYVLAKRLKLKQVVYHSVFRADRFPDVPHFASKIMIENAIKTFDLPFTIIRPNVFFQNDASLKDVILGAGIYPLPLGTPGVSAVDVRDIAEASAIALTTEGHLGKTYNLNGPEVLSGEKVASIWSRLLGRTIQYPGEDMDRFEAQFRQHSPAWSAFDMRMMFQGYLERGFEAEDGDLETLTAVLGHSPRRYEDYVNETVLAWQ
ncbi:MAG: NmrA family NAD(P)-binding protein [Proteobacteria bacterium]|nr:NmrA family NAD(P)-binding protein [Pseudomonadota bacterium]